MNIQSVINILFVKSVSDPTQVYLFSALMVNDENGRQPKYPGSD